MRINSFFSKLLLIFSILLFAYFYAVYEKNKYYSIESSVNVLALKSLPVFNAIDVLSGVNINSYDFLKGSKGTFVHIWGTWCGPCEKEMPEFLKYAENVSPKGIKFLLVAVNDEQIKVKKFLSRFNIPKNVTIVIDKSNTIMDMFGTFKVPESFLFDLNGKHINKFVGPQEWLQQSYSSRLELWLNARNPIERKIETH